MTTRQINYALIDYKKSGKQLAEGMRELGYKVADTQVYDVLAERYRSNGVVAKVVEAAEKVIRRWEEDAAKKKTTP